MLSTRDLWCVISGKSSLSDPDIIAEELARYEAHLQNGIDFYKKPSTPSEAKVKSTDTVKRKDFILKLSKLLNLDEWQTHELFQNYLRMDFRGSGPQLQAILKHDVQCEGFLMKVLEFYFKERSFLLKCIKYLVSYWQDDTCLFQEKFAKVVDDFANGNVISKFIKQLKNLFKQPAAHNGIKGNLSAQNEFAHQFVEEQCDLVEIIFLYYKDFEMSADVFLDFLNFFRCQHFGFSQVNRKHLGPPAQELCERFGFISSLVLLEALDLDLLRKTISGHDSPDATEHAFLGNQIWKKVDELLCTWDDVVQQGPVLMAWTIFRHTCLPPNCQQLTKLFGDSAMRCNLILYLNNLLSYPIFHQENDPLAGLVKAYVYILLSLMLSVFHENTLGNYEVIVSIGCKVLSEPSLSTVFFTQDQAEGIGILLNSSRKCFPFAICPYLNLLKSLCTSHDASELVFEMLEKQTTLAELFGKNSVTEIEASDMENVWKRKSEKILLKYENDSIVLTEGTYGKVVLHQQETRVIRWTSSYSGWLYLMLQLNSIAENPMTSCSDSGEDGASIAICIIELVSSIINHDPTKIEDFEPIISVLFRLIRRVSMMSSPPLELLSTIIKCLQFVVQVLPLQTWQQLVATKFLPHPKQLVSSTNSSGFEAGLYGVILHQCEIPSAYFIVTKEYVNFVLQFLHGLSALEDDDQVQLESIYEELSVNVVFIIKEILSNFGRWRYSDAEHKQKIGLFCLETCHLLLSANFDNIIPRELTRKLPSLQNLLQEGLLFQHGGESLLNIISVGVDNIDDITSTKIRQTTDVIQLIKLSFAVLNLLLRNNSKNVDISPLEDVLRQQYVMQISELDFIQKATKVTLLSVIARYVYHRLDPKLPILATIVLSTLAARFPLVLTASFGDSLIGIRNVFVNRLNGRVEAVRLKVAIIEFLTTCVETQPGIVESFCHITSVGKDKTLTFGKFSCILPILEYIDCKQQFDVLSSGCLEFIAALWVNRYDVAMTLIKKKKTFWKIITSPLLDLQNCQVKKPVMEIITHILNIISFETYYVKSDEFDEELRKNLKNISNCNCYEQIGKLVIRVDEDKTFMTSQLALLKAWKIFVTVMIKVEACVCGLEEGAVINQIFRDVLTAMKNWIKCDVVAAYSMISELTELCLTLTCKRNMLLSEPGEILHELNAILHEIMTTDPHAYEAVQTSLYAAANNILKDRKDEVCEKDKIGYLLLAENVCKWLQFYGIQKKHQQNTMEFLTGISLLNEITHCSPANHINSLNVIFKEHGTMYNLINRLDMSFKENANFEQTELILTFIMTCSQKQQVAEHLCSCGIANLLCLSVKSIYAEKTHVDRDKRLKIWALVVGIIARLLKILRHVFLESTINFIGTHKETILQSMNLMEQVVEDRLFSAEQTAILCYEIVQYSNDISFALPEVFQHIRFGMMHMVRLSVALLGRQKLLNHLLECKAGDNIEPLLNRTKTPSPTSFRSDSIKSAVTNDAADGLSPDAELVQNRLINVLCYLVGALRRLTPNVIETVLDEGMDIDSFIPLVDLDFKSPSLENNSSPSFGALVSCLNISLKLIHKMSLSDSDRTTPEKDFSSVNLPDAEKKRAILWCIIDNALVVLLSQASCYLRHPNIDERGKQFLKRELGTELSNFLYAVHRLRTRRGIPPSPIQYDKIGLIPPSVKRSPSKLSTSFLEEEENSFFKLIDIYTKNLLR